MIILNLASNSATAATLSCDLNLLHCYYSCRCEGREGGGGRKSIQSITDGLPIAVAAGRCGRRSSPAFCNGPADRPRRARGTRKWARERQQRAVAVRPPSTPPPPPPPPPDHFASPAQCTLILSLFAPFLSLLRVREERRRDGDDDSDSDKIALFRIMT